MRCAITWNTFEIPSSTVAGLTVNVLARQIHGWPRRSPEGQIDVARIAELKKAIARTGVFELKGHCYLVPDAAVDCVMLDFGENRQMLYWDEVEAPNYGINSSGKPHHASFKKRWKEVNALALQAIPKEAQRYNERFERPPESWRLKPAIQSE